MTLNFLISNPLWLFATVYAVSTVLMALLVPHQLATWDRSNKKRKLPSLFLRWHPGCPSCVEAHGYAVVRPDNDDKMQLWLFAFTPVLNTSMLIWYALVIPCVMLHNIFVLMFFGGEDNYQRWLRAH